MPPPTSFFLPLRPPQEEAFDCGLGVLGLVWRRQFGKSYTLAAITLEWMMQTPGVLVTLISAAIRLGEENIRKEMDIWRQVMTQLRSAVQEKGLKLTTTGDDDDGELLDVDALCDIFASQKLRTQLWFDNVTNSRSMVIAPNPDTAVGNTGHVIMDEVGRMPDFRAMWEAAEPFIASRPEFKIRLATTPPPDDSHFSYELLAPEDPDQHFPVNARGNFYTSQAGLPIHRVDAWDAFAAGVPVFDLKTREPLTPEQSRERALDKDAWDRNFGCKFLKGGSAALSLDDLTHAMAAGRELGLAVDVREEIRLKEAA
jgi:hypothetical protein